MLRSSNVNRSRRLTRGRRQSNEHSKSISFFAAYRYFPSLDDCGAAARSTASLSKIWCSNWFELRTNIVDRAYGRKDSGVSEQGLHSSAERLLLVHRRGDLPAGK